MNIDLKYIAHTKENFLFSSNDALVKKTRALSKYINFTIIIISLLVLIGWEFRIEIIKRPIPHLVAMNPLTALLFLLSGISFLFLTKKPLNRIDLLTGKTFAFAVLFLGLLRFMAVVANLDIPVDTIFFKQKLAENIGNNISNGMAENTAFNFVLSGCILLLINAKSKRAQVLAQLASVALFLLSLLFMIGYLYHVTARSGMLLYVPMAIHTAFCFILFSLSVLFANPSDGIMRQLTSSYSGSFIGRLLIGASIVIPVFLGFFRLLGASKGYFPLQLGTALLILAIVIIFIGLSWFVVLSLNSRDFQKQQVDLSLLESQDQIRTIFNAAPDAVIVIDDYGKIVKWNPKAESIFGWDEKEVLGKTLNETIIPGRFRKLHENGLDHFLQTGEAPLLGKIVETYALNKNGFEFEIALSIAPTQKIKGHYLFVGFVRDISEAKRKEEELRKSEKDFQLLVSSVKDYAIIMLDTEGNVASWNNGAANIKGFASEEIIGKYLGVFYTNEDVKKGIPESNLQMALKFGHYETDGWRLRKDGSRFYANVVFTALYDDKNKLYGYAKVTKNITEKRKAEERISFLATIAGNIQDPIISSDKELRITGWNEAAERLLEWKNEEVIGKTTTEILNVLYPAETREQIQESFSENGFWKGEVVYHTKSGKEINILATASHLKDASGNFTGNLVLARDITERKRAEAALSKLNAELEERVKERTDELFNREIRFRALIENNEDIIGLLDENLQVIYRSPASERIIGWTNEDRKAAGSREHIHPDDAEYAAEIMTKVLANPGKSFGITFRAKHKNGNYIWLDGVVRNMLHDRSIKAIITNLRNITETKEAEEKIKKLNIQLEERVELRTAQLKKSNEELEAFSYSVSHDLRAPLRGIIGFANILEEEYTDKLDDEARRLTRIIKRNTSKMGQLIDDLLTFSRMGRQQITKTHVDNNKIISEILEDQNINKNMQKIKWTLHPLPGAKADINTIRQVWVNLISNAIKYSRNVENPEIEIGSIKNQVSTTFFVKDNGVGFDEKYKNKLFKVFQRLHSSEEFEGTGIGLAIVDKIISKHGGKVWAESELNNGAAFYFSLPANNKSK